MGSAMAHVIKRYTTAVLLTTNFVQCLFFSSVCGSEHCQHQFVLNLCYMISIKKIKLISIIPCFMFTETYIFLALNIATQVVFTIYAKYCSPSESNSDDFATVSFIQDVPLSEEVAEVKQLLQKEIQLRKAAEEEANSLKNQLSQLISSEVCSHSCFAVPVVQHILPSPFFPGFPPS